MKRKHIAMWACPRTRSSAVTRAFEQIDECIIYDEPFIDLSFSSGVNYHDAVGCLPSSYGDDYPEIVTRLTGNLPEGKSFSFQKHMSFHLRPELDKSWIAQVDNCFLIRNPKESILSYWKARRAGGFSWEESRRFVGWEEHYQLFKEVLSYTVRQPVVLDSGDLVKDPEGYLRALCTHLKIEFSTKMLSWEAEKTSLISWKNSMFEKFRSDVIHSEGFFDRPQIEEIPEVLMPCIERCMPLYEEMYEYRIEV